MNPWHRFAHSPIIRRILDAIAGALVAVVCFSVYSVLVLKQVPFSVGCGSYYPLTNGALDCGEYMQSSVRLQALDAELEAATNQYVARGKATRVSVWVRDLTSQQYAASNENETYVPASLLKVPLLITYYKLAEVEPSVLGEPLVYMATSAQNDKTQNFMPQSKLVSGQTYPVSRLIESMMIDSDNDAAGVLLSHLGHDTLNTTLVDLGIQVPTQSGTLDYVTVKSYAAIFRILYNASYLDRNYSEKALELMSRSTFKGVAAPLPSTVVVAHKFGERKVLDANGTVTKEELHDCGIVFKQNTPYSICIMTQGSDFTDLQSIITDLSAMIYKGM